MHVKENAGIASWLVKGGLNTKDLATAVTSTKTEKQVEKAAEQNQSFTNKIAILSCVCSRCGCISTQRWISRNHVTAVMTTG